MHLFTTLLGVSHKTENVVGHCTWNVDDYGPEVEGHLLIGRTQKEFDAFVMTSGWPKFVARQTLEALVAKLGLTVKSVSSNVAPLIMDEPLQCRSLGVDIPTGSIVGTTDQTVVKNHQGPRFEFAMEGRVYRDGEGDRRAQPEA